jgi:uncharacterized protein (TIGR02147 family)
MSTTNYDNYREIIFEEFQKRVDINPAYSLRAFAQKLEISPSRLSEVLNKKQGLSVKWALKISKKLNFDQYKATYFELLVESDHGKSTLLRSKAMQKLRKFKTEYIKNLPLDHYALISDWHHGAIMELVKTKTIEHSIKWIAKRLGITEASTSSAIERLQRLGVIKVKVNKYICTDFNPLSTISHTPSEVIKEHHSQIMKKAHFALFDQALNEREFNSLIFAISDEDIPEIKKKILNFFNELNITYSDPNKINNRVYALSTQFFDLLKKEEQ